MADRKFAVLCAYNGGNSGMVSVDLAAHEFFTRHQLPFTIFCPQPYPTPGDNPHPLQTISPVRSIADFEGYTHIVYWGDFQNNPWYGQNDYGWRRVNAGLSESRAEAFQSWMELFALTGGRPASVRKVISVGNNFQNAFKLQAHQRRAIEKGFLENFDHVLPRDPCSLRMALTQYGRAFWSSAEPGIDAAFLLASHEVAAAASAGEGYFCYFFGRSKIANTDALVATVARKLKLRAVPVPGWLRPRQLRKVLDAFPGALALLRDSRFLISDTYHCCINAMNLGTPVVGLGVETPEQVGTLGDFKKRELFGMFALGDMYVSLAGPMVSETEIAAVVDRATYAVECSDFAGLRYGRIAEMRARMERRLLEVLV